MRDSEEYNYEEIPPHWISEMDLRSRVAFKPGEDQLALFPTADTFYFGTYFEDAIPEAADAEKPKQ